MQYVQRRLAMGQEGLDQFAEVCLWLSESDRKSVLAIRNELAGALNYDPTAWSLRFVEIFAERFADLDDWNLDD